MTNIDLEGLSLDNLPYPMFETTEEEKDCLREALPHIAEEATGLFTQHIGEIL
jgi:hypothetical protein